MADTAAPHVTRRGRLVLLQYLEPIRKVLPGRGPHSVVVDNEHKFRLARVVRTRCDPERPVSHAVWCEKWRRTCGQVKASAANDLVGRNSDWAGKYLCLWTLPEMQELPAELEDQEWFHTEDARKALAPYVEESK